MLLWDTLLKAGLVADSECYRVGRTIVSEWGLAELEELRAWLGVRTCRRAFAAFPSPLPDSHQVRILGYGRLLTEFAIAPVSLSLRAREEIARLGSLANFMIAIYDKYVDLLADDGAVLPRRALLDAVRDRKSVRLMWLRVLGSPGPRLMIRLLTLYRRRAKRLVLRAAMRPSVAGVMRRAIMTMYDAESDTRGKPGQTPTQRTLRRKSALPFVVMGLPAWVATDQSLSARYRWHLRWLYRLGEFLGWIDDAVDLEEDHHAGQPNRVKHVLSQRLGADGDDFRLAHRIAQQGQRVVAEWRERAREVPYSHPIVRDALPVTVCSWFGGL